MLYVYLLNMYVCTKSLHIYKVTKKGFKLSLRQQLSLSGVVLPTASCQVTNRRLEEKQHI